MIPSTIREVEATIITLVNDFDANNTRIKNLEIDIQKCKRIDEEMKTRCMKAVSIIQDYALKFNKLLAQIELQKECKIAKNLLQIRRLRTY